MTSMDSAKRMDSSKCFEKLRSTNPMKYECRVLVLKNIHSLNTCNRLTLSVLELPERSRQATIT